MVGLTLDELKAHKETITQKREAARSSMEQYHGALQFIDFLMQELEAKEKDLPEAADS